MHFTCGSSDSDSESDVDDSDNSNSGKRYVAKNVDEEQAKPLRFPSYDSEVLEMIMVKDVKAGVEVWTLCLSNYDVIVNILHFVEEEAIRIFYMCFVYVHPFLLCQVFNTYGSAGNAALLHRYGFTEPNNVYDIVNIDLELVLKWCSSMFSCRHSRSRLALWRKLDYCGCFSENSEYFEISFIGEPQVEMLILLYIMLLPEDEYCKLDLNASIASYHNDTISMILSENTNPKFDKGLEIDKKRLLTDGVCNALLCLAEERENLYGSDSIKNDIEAMEKCTEKVRMLYHSLMLRVSERRILEKFRTYATLGLKKLNTCTKSSERKRLRKA